MADRAVTLRILSGSQEADFLAAYCPILEIPALIVIQLAHDMRNRFRLGLTDTGLNRNGGLVAHLRAGIGFEEFERSVSETLSQDVAHTSGNSPIESMVPVDETNGGSEVHHGPESWNHERQSEPAAALENTTSSDPASSESPSLQDSGPNPSPSTIQQMMEDRRRRLEIDKATKDAAEAEKRKIIAQARREAAGAAPATTISRQSQYAHEQRKRQQEAKAEKKRILREIENNKTERKEREAQRRALAKAEAVETLNQGSAEFPIDQIIPKSWNPDTQLRSCSLQVRLFNGATIRGKFASGQTVSNDIRTWIASQRTDGDTPFTLKQILSPLPNRIITISEEQESLQSLEFLPSATLVMVPIKGYTDAFDNDSGIVGRAMSVGYNAASAGGKMLKDVVGTFLGFGRAASNDEDPVAEEEGHSSTNPQTANGVEGLKFRTLRRQGDRDEDHQLYNGNQV
ncbi:MAG: hypothetical protein Q9202_003058 [Teloschistes flavicans]